MTIASSGGRPASGPGIGCRRRGPTSWEGEARLLHTGSTSTRRPSISSSAVAWPYQMTLSPAGDGPPDGEVTTGTGAAGRRSSRLRNMFQAISRALCGEGTKPPGMELRKTPSWNCGERRIRSSRSPSALPPSSAGMSFSAHPAAASASPPARRRPIDLLPAMRFTLLKSPVPAERSRLRRCSRYALGETGQHRPVKERLSSLLHSLAPRPAASPTLFAALMPVKSIAAIRPGGNRR